MRCPVCSREIEDNSEYCVYCNTDISAYENENKKKYSYLDNLSGAAYALRIRRMKLENRLQKVIDLYEQNVSFDIEKNVFVRDNQVVDPNQYTGLNKNMSRGDDSNSNDDIYQKPIGEQHFDNADLSIKESYDEKNIGYYDKDYNYDFNKTYDTNSSLQVQNNSSQQENDANFNVVSEILDNADSTGEQTINHLTSNNNELQDYSDNLLSNEDEKQTIELNNQNNITNVQSEDSKDVIYNEDVKFEGEDNPIYEIKNDFNDNKEFNEIENSGSIANIQNAYSESSNTEVTNNEENIKTKSDIVEEKFATDIKNNDEYLNYNDQGEKVQSIEDVIEKTTRFEESDDSDFIEEKPQKLSNKEKRKQKLLKKLQKRNGNKPEYKGKAVLKDNEVLKKSKHKSKEYRFCGKVAWGLSLILAIVTLLYFLAVIMRDNLMDQEVVSGAMYYVVIILAYTDYIIYGIIACSILTFLNCIMQIIMAPRKFALFTFIFTLAICSGVICYFYFFGYMESAIQSIFVVIRGLTG